MDEQLRRPTPAPVANCRSGCSAANATFSMARAVRGRRKTGTSINAVVAGGGMPCACDSRRAMTTTKIAAKRGMQNEGFYARRRRHRLNQVVCTGAPLH